MNQKGISVTSHVARDFLQSAAVFNSLPKVVWEYVSNSLDNGKESTQVHVIVELEGTSLLRISDDGTGMSKRELEHFFQMHGVNIKRTKGKRVRGRFGTGKSAAFGVASQLRIDTVKVGKRNVVELARLDIERAADGRPFPVKHTICDETTDQPDGTKVEISGFLIPHLDLEKTIAYVERHLARYKGQATVVINDHICRFQEPPSTMTIEYTPPPPR